MAKITARAKCMMGPRSAVLVESIKSNGGGCCGARVGEAGWGMQISGGRGGRVWVWWGAVGWCGDGGVCLCRHLQTHDSATPFVKAREAIVNGLEVVMPHFFHENCDSVEFAVVGREINFWKRSKRNLSIRRLADLRSEKTPHDDSAVPGVETFFVAIYFVKKQSARKGRGALGKGVVNALHARAVAIVAQGAVFGKKGQVTGVGAHGT